MHKPFYIKKYKNIKILIFLIESIFVFLCLNVKLLKCENLNENLFFVGEDIRILTIASRRPELPEKAPAVGTVITAQELQERGIRTLGEALSMIPGFYIAYKEWGAKPYLRGIPEGILFLYDGVPLTSDSTKAIHPLDEELSLAAISRIEIIRGPGSVLWGPDAFAGIVNIVPKKGNEINGIEIGSLVGSPLEDKYFYLNFGKDTGLWNGFFSISSYWQDPIEKKYYLPSRNGKIGSAEYYDLVFTFKLLNFLYLSGRFSQFRHPFVMYAPEKNFSWPGLRENPVSFLRVEMEKRFEHSSLRFKGYYNYLNLRHQEVSVLQQKNYIFYGELLYNQELWNNRGLLTLGSSYRKNLVRDATINIRGFLPDYLNPNNLSLEPLVDIANFETELSSIFFQYRHHFHKIDLWGGVRLDDHNQYHSTISYNFGIGLFNYQNFYLKLLYGTAYRTPYSAQFLQIKNPDPEEITNLSAELFLKPNHNFSIKLTPFYNSIKRHVAEDPFGGFSYPTRAKFLGLETDLEFKFTHNLSGWLNFTTFSHWGDREKYHVLDYIIITPDGEKPFYTDYWKDFDYGAKKLANFGLKWCFHPRVEAFLRLYYIGSRKLYLLKTGEVKNFSPVWLGDLTLRYHKTLESQIWDIEKISKFSGKKKTKKIDFELSIKNLWNTRYHTPGTFAPLKGKPFSVFLTMKFSW